MTGAKIQSDAVVELTVEGAAGSTIAVTVAEVGNASGLPMPEPVTVVGDYSILNQTIINPIGVLGYAEAADGKIYLYNGGGDYWGSADTSILTLSEKVEGDFDVVLCVESIENNYSWAKVGLTFRASLDADSPNVSMLTSPSRVQATTRPYPAGSSSYDSFPQISVAEDGTETIGLVSYNNYSYETFPTQWLRIKREGDVFFCYRSLNGKYWTLVTDGDFMTVGTNSTYQMPASGYLGIVYTAQDQNALHQAVVSGYNTAYVEPELPR